MQAWNRLFIDQVGSVPPMLAALLLVFGVIVLLLGWRLSRLVAALDLSIFGLLVGAALAPGSDVQWLCAGAGAVAFGGLALWLDRYSDMIAGGLTAGVAAALVLCWLEAPLLGVLLGVVATFGCAVAFSYTATKEATAVTTALQGGLVATFGLASCLASNQVWWELREVLAGSSVAMAMFLAAPFGVGVTFQLASIQNEEVVAQ